MRSPPGEQQLTRIRNVGLTKTAGFTDSSSESCPQQRWEVFLVNRWKHLGEFVASCSCIWLEMHWTTDLFREEPGSYCWLPHWHKLFRNSSCELCFLPSILSRLPYLIMVINDFASLHRLIAGLQACDSCGREAQSLRKSSLVQEVSTPAG